MKTHGHSNATGLIGVSAITLLLLFNGMASAHCDTMDGPVVTDAKKALESGDVNLVLKWVKKEHEEEIRAAFSKTLAVRALSEDAREVADLWFFETLVRVHRAGEGAPYTGLKPAGSDPHPAVKAADNALATGSIDVLADSIAKHAAAAVRERYERVREARKKMNDSVEAGRRYVEAYVEYVHYVENLHNNIAGAGTHHDGE